MRSLGIFSFKGEKIGIGSAAMVLGGSLSMGNQKAPVASTKASAQDLQFIRDFSVSIVVPRRTFVTAAESADISPLALSALVNHSLGRDVTSGYVVMTAERLREPAQRVADHLKLLIGLSGQSANP